MGLQLLVELELDSGTRYFADIATAAADRFFEPRILSIDGIERSVPALPGDFRTSDLSVTFDNADNEFSKLRAAEPLRNRQCNVLLGDPDKGLGDFSRVFSGKLRGWSLDAARFSIDVVDVLSERFEPAPRWTITQSVFPHKPATTPAALIPLVMGTVSSPGGGGALPAYLVDPGEGQLRFRYVIAQGAAKSVTAVYNYGTLVAASQYTVVNGPGPGGTTITFLDFLTDQRDPDRAGELEVTWDGAGLTDDDTPGGNLVENPIRQFEEFLLRQGFTAAELDAASFTAAADLATTLGFKGAVAVVNAEARIRDVVDQFAESFNLLVFPVKSGALSISLLSAQITDDPSLPQLSDSVDVAADTFGVAPQQDAASSLRILWQRNYQRNEWEDSDTESDSAQASRLGMDVAHDHEMWFVRDERTKALLATDRLFFQREERLLVTVGVNPELARTLDVGSDIKLTHHAGVDASGGGFQDRLLRIVAWRLSVPETGAALELECVDFGVLGVDFPFETFEFGPEQDQLLTNYLPGHVQAGEAPILVDQFELGAVS